MYGIRITYKDGRSESFTFDTEREQLEKFAELFHDNDYLFLSKS